MASSIGLNVVGYLSFVLRLLPPPIPKLLVEEEKRLYLSLHPFKNGARYHVKM